MEPTPPPGYLDAASGEPLHPAATAAVHAALDQAWADPARRYSSGRRARLLLDAARESVAAVLGARPDEVSFTASGTQAVQLGLSGLLAARARAGSHLVASAVEHSAVLHLAQRHAAAGGTTTLAGVDARGRVELDEWVAAVQAPGTAAAALQTANHEVGTRQPVAEAAAACDATAVPLLVDAAQTVGRPEPLPDGWSVLAASAPKWGGPAGVGVLVVRRGTRWEPPLAGSRPRRRPRAGLPAVPLIVAAATALDAVAGPAARGAARAEDARLVRLVDRIRAQIVLTIPDVQVLGDPVDRLPHVVTFSFLYVDGEALLDALDREGFAVSSGSSCTADTLEPSHVLVAMGALTHGNLRVSLPRGVAEADVERFLAVLPGVVAAVRGEIGADAL